MIDVTPQQVKHAVLSAGLAFIQHHTCGICGVMVGYHIQNKDLVFNGGCDCGDGTWRPNDWRNAAEWINMQTREEHKIEIAKRFGLDPDNLPVIEPSPPLDIADRSIDEVLAAHPKLYNAVRILIDGCSSHDSSKAYAALYQWDHARRESEQC